MGRCSGVNAWAADWPQWCGSDGKNMVSAEKGLPDPFVPGEKDSQSGGIKPGTAKNVKWARKLCQAIYSTPVIAGGRIFVGGRQGDGVAAVPGRATGKLLWQWQGPAKEVPHISTAGTSASASIRASWASARRRSLTGTACTS